MAFGSATFSDAGGAVSDIFGAFGHNAKASTDEAEAASYGIAANLADLNAEYTDTSTKIQVAQKERQIGQVLGEQKADVAGAGFAESGTALDLLRDSAQQGSLAKTVLAEQGAITAEGYRMQAETYRIMQKAAGEAASAEKFAGIGSFVGGAIKGAAAIATL